LSTVDFTCERCGARLRARAGEARTGKCGSCGETLSIPAAGSSLGGDEPWWVLDQGVVTGPTPGSLVRTWLAQGSLSHWTMVAGPDGRWAPLKDKVTRDEAKEGFERWAESAIGRIRLEMDVPPEQARTALLAMEGNVVATLRALRDPSPLIEAPFTGAEHRIDDYFAKPGAVWASWGALVVSFLVFSPLTFIVGAWAVFKGTRWTTKVGGKRYALIGSIGAASLLLWLMCQIPLLLIGKPLEAP